MIDKDYYVTLTGGKNNAGDFLIKYRAFNLFKELLFPILLYKPPIKELLFFISSNICPNSFISLSYQLNLLYPLILNHYIYNHLFL